MLAGNQVWWKLSPTSSAPPPHPVPPTACVRSCFIALWSFPAAQLSSLVQRKSLTHLGLVCPGVPGAHQSREICASTSMAHASDLQSWEPSEAGREKRGNPIPSSHLCPGCSLGFYLDCSPSMLKWPCVWATILSPPPPLLPVCQYKHFWTLPGDQMSDLPAKYPSEQQRHYFWGTPFSQANSVPGHHERLTSGTKGCSRGQTAQLPSQMVSTVSQFRVCIKIP